MANESVCPLCRSHQGPRNEALGDNGPLSYLRCPRCGLFGAEDDFFDALFRASLVERRGLIAWLSDRESDENTPILTEELLQRLSKIRRIRISEMADRLLAYCVSHSASVGSSFDPKETSVQQICYAVNSDEVLELTRYLQGLGYMWTDSVVLRVLPQGFQKIEEGGQPRADSNQVFVAMWFGDEMLEIYEEGFAPAILSTGFETLRIDRKEHNKKIDDEIIAELRRSKFVIADFTKQRGGVYFEAGFALGLNIPVIWCCRKDDIENLHFDIRQYNCIDWTTAGELRARLENRILALIGKGQKS